MLDNIRKQIYILKKKWPSRLRVKRKHPILRTNANSDGSAPPLY